MNYPINKELMKNPQRCHFQQSWLSRSAFALESILQTLGVWVLSLRSKKIQLNFGNQVYKFDLLKLLGIIIGGFIIVLCMQHSASAQMLQDAEESVADVFGDYLPEGADDIVEVMFGIARVIFFGLLFVVIAFAANEARRGGNMDVWFAAGSVLVMGLVLMQAASVVVFGS